MIQYHDKLRLLEVAQVPKDHEEDFKSVKKFSVFNTNNLWINLPGKIIWNTHNSTKTCSVREFRVRCTFLLSFAAIKRVIENNELDMEVIVNPKTLDGGINVLQLETAVGAAMKCFENGMGVKVRWCYF